MSIAVVCTCGKKYRFRDEHAGKRAKCKCGQVLSVPQPSISDGFHELLDGVAAEDLMRGAPATESLHRLPAKKSQSSEALIVTGAAAVAFVVIIMIAVILWPRSRPSSDLQMAQTPDRTMLPTKRQERESKNLVKLGAANPKRISPDPAKTPPPTESEQTTRIRVSTNVHGATIVVRDLESKQDVNRVVLEGSERGRDFQLKPQHNYEFEARLADELIVKRRRTDEHQQISLDFDPLIVREICRLAVCLIRLPEGGFGSGFIFGDRTTIVTAAHVLTTKNVDDVEIVFNPAEDNETLIRGARLVYFDADQDVAVLRLEKPVEESRPFLWPVPNVDSQQGSVANKDVIVIGNPGRGHDYDPLYIRKSKIVGGRPDEFQLDIELKPGYSGGPICLSQNGQVAGLVSYKIVGGVAYEDVGKTFAKSVDIAEDALENWHNMSPARRQSRVERLANEFARQYGYRCAAKAGINLYQDANVYTGICVEVANDYRNYMTKMLRSIPGSANPRLVRAKMLRTHKEYIRKRAAEKSKEVREKVSPQLQPQTDKWYEEAIGDDNVPGELKNELKLAYDSCRRLKESTERINFKDIDDFVESAIKSWSETSEHALKVIQQVR